MPVFNSRYVKAWAFISLLGVLFQTWPVEAVTPPGISISNTARANYSIAGYGAKVVDSNSVETTTVALRSPSILEFLHYAPSVATAELVPVSTTAYESATTGVFTPMPAPMPVGASSPIDLSNSLPLVPVETFHQGEPLFLRLTDLDQNKDALVAETIIVTLSISNNGDIEVIRLTESFPDSGVFTGYIATGVPPPINRDGVLTVSSDTTITGSYSDSADSLDTSQLQILVDPFGVVFDSVTGNPVNGVQVTLFDTATGLPAAVYGDDGVSLYPATIISGDTAIDSSGRIYDFAPGAYRFPFVAPGSYRLEVVTPDGYGAPSTVATTGLQNLPGAPFAIVDPGSRGEAFNVNPGPALHIDIPVDPVIAGLFMQKKTAHETVAIGDFIAYEIVLENTTILIANDVVVTDRLPWGFRYQNGSVRVDGQPGLEPLISADGRTLSFSLSPINSQGTIRIHYVAEVTAAAKLGNAINQAQASNSILNSNLAQATVKVVEDLLRDKNILVGRVAVVESCDDINKMPSAGVKGVRVYLEDGAYVSTDEQGLFHFEGVDSGTRVVQLDLDSIPEQYEVQACEDNSRFAGRSFSQFVDLKGGSLWRTDFYVTLKPPSKGEVRLGLQGVFEGHAIVYRLPITGSTVPLGNVRLTVMLPAASRYVSGSSRLSGVTLPDPTVMGNTLTYSLGDMPGDWSKELHFIVQPRFLERSMEFVSKALLSFDTPETKNQRSPLVEHTLLHVAVPKEIKVSGTVIRPKFGVFSAELSADDKLMLDGVLKQLEGVSLRHIVVTGHTDTTPIAPRSRHIYRDNYALSYARARSVGRYLAEQLGLPPSKISLFGKGADEPLAANHTSEGRELNRRVDVQVVSRPIQHAPMVRAAVPQREVHVETFAPHMALNLTTKEFKTPVVAMPTFDETWLENAKPGLEWLWPITDYSPSIPSIKLAIKHHPRDKLTVLLNGEKIPALNFDGISKNASGSVAVSRWTGVDLRDGDNYFEVIVQKAESEDQIVRLNHNVHYSGPPVQAELVMADSYLVADGRQPPVLAIRFSDQAGYPARAGVVGELSIDAPYRVLQKQGELQRDRLNTSPQKNQFTIGEQGIALIELQPTTRSGEVVLRLPLENGDHDVRAWLKPKSRDWILVGLAEGTVGYNAVKGNMEHFEQTDGNDDIYTDGRISFFAKGRIKGEWLLTAAYDSARSQRDEGDSLFNTIDPDSYYTLYGDNTNQDYDAASARELYLKIERDQFYALFGDYTTGLTITELSKYNRSFNGIKSEMHGEKFSWSVFASDTNQRFIKDELRGNGTSGLYSLSRNTVIVNSEQVVIETRDRFRSEVIVSRQVLQRHIDYNVDYHAGTLFFKSPVFSADAAFNPVFIVVDYESRGAGNQALHYGGRGALRVLEDRLEFGATHIYEDQGQRNNDLNGLDATVKIGDHTELKAEVATSSKDDGISEKQGNAYLAELNHRAAKLEGKFYLRKQDEAFGLGQQNGSENGTQKIGTELRYRHNNQVTSSGQIYQQKTLATDAQREIAEAQLEYRDEGMRGRIGLRQANDSLDNGDRKRSSQLSAGIQQQFLNKRLNTHVNHDQSVFGNNASADFPTRTLFGLDYRINDVVSVFAEQEFTQGQDEDTRGTRMGLKASPWHGGKLSSSVEQQTTEHGPRAFANLGLNHTWQASQQWRLDFGVDRSETIKHPGAVSVNPNVPPASGNSSNFMAISVGAGYRQDNWSWTSRFELRDAETENKWSVTSGILGEPRKGLGLSAQVQLFNTDTNNGIEKHEDNIRLGLAYRPANSQWTVLDRLDLNFEKERGGQITLNNRKLINNLNLNYKANRKTQLAFQFGTKYVRNTIENTQYSGLTTLLGVEVRHDLNTKWDVGMHAAHFYSWQAAQNDYGVGASLGYYFIDNLWMSVGYNFKGLRDRDFSQGSFRSHGVFLRIRMKVDQQSIRELLGNAE